MVCAFKTMRTIRFCAVLVAVCAVFALGVAVGGAGQGLQRFQIVTLTGDFAGALHRLDRWTGETWVSIPPLHPGMRFEWRPLPVSTQPLVNMGQPVAAQPVPQSIPQPSGNVQFLPSPPPADGAIRIQNGHSYRYNATTGRWE
jgi:hypothetical protein